MNLFCIRLYSTNNREILESQDPLVEMDFQDSAVYLDHQVLWVHQEKTVTRVNLVNPARKDLKAAKEML